MSPTGTGDGRARLVFRRLKSATGVAGIGELEEQVTSLEVAVAESRALEEPLGALLDRVEAQLVPLLERRARRYAGPA